MSDSTTAISDLQQTWCSVDRIDELQAFIHQHWRRGHILSRDRELLTWQFTFPENADNLSVLLAERDGEIGGMLGLIPFPFCYRGERTQGVWLSTWIVAPQFRSQGIGLRLLQGTLLINYEVVGTLCVNATTIQILKAFRFSTRDSLPRWVRVFSIDLLESLLVDQSSEDKAVYLKDWGLLGSSPICGRSSRNCLPWSEELASRWDHYWRILFAPRVVGGWRDSNYLRHRYVNHPRFTYQVWFEENFQGELTGLLVYRLADIRDHSAKVLRVVEYLTCEEVSTGLNQKIEEAGKQNNVAFADFTCTNLQSGIALAQSGFVPEGPTARCLPSRFQPLDLRRSGMTGAFWMSPKLSQNGRDIQRIEDLYFTGGDCDQDRPN